MLELPQYLFPSSSSDGKFRIYQLPEGLGMRKILPHWLRMQKNPQSILWIFTDFQSYAGSKSKLHPRTEISAMVSVYWLTPNTRQHLNHLLNFREFSTPLPTILTPPTIRDPRVPKHFE